MTATPPNSKEQYAAHLPALQNHRNHSSRLAAKERKERKDQSVTAG